MSSNRNLKFGDFINKTINLLKLNPYIGFLFILLIIRRVVKIIRYLKNIDWHHFRGKSLENININYNKINSADKTTFVVFDLETTGLDPLVDEIIEIGAIKVINGKTVDTFNQLIRPQKSIPKEVSRINGITNDMVFDKPNLELVLPSFIEFIGNYRLVAHNADFDMRFLLYNTRNLIIDNEVTDTLALSKKFFPSFSSYSLVNLSKALNLNHPNAHRALSDSTATMELYLKCHNKENNLSSNFEIESPELNTRLYLNVFDPEKDQAKALGAKWDPKRKEWYVDDSRIYHLFRKWYYNQEANGILHNYIYIAVANRVCFKCNKQTQVISLASTDSTYIDEDGDIIEENSMDFFCYIYFLPENLSRLLKEKYNFYCGYSKHTKSYYYGNHCSHCGSLQGENYLHNEFDGVFNVFNMFINQNAKNITLYKLILPEAIQIGYKEISSSSIMDYEHILLEYGEINDLIV